jgi:hypothetical protein
MKAGSASTPRLCESNDSDRRRARLWETPARAGIKLKSVLDSFTNSIDGLLTVRGTELTRGSTLMGRPISQCGSSQASAAVEATAMEINWPDSIATTAITQLQQIAATNFTTYNEQLIRHADDPTLSPT